MYKIQRQIKQLLQNIIEQGPVSDEVIESLSYLKLMYPDIFKTFESRLMYAMGVFYKPLKPKDIMDYAFEYVKLFTESETQACFTPMQYDIYKQIKCHKYVSFSAPTSSGKSFVFLYLLQHSLKDIIIIVPTRSLIFEYMKKVSNAFKDDKSVFVSQFVEDINRRRTKRRIFILTPERAIDLFQFKNKLSVELVLFDEAHLSEDVHRGLLFDSIFRKMNIEFKDSKFVFAHPFVANPGAQFSKHDIHSDSKYESAFKQKVVGQVFLTYENQEFCFQNLYCDIEVPQGYDVVERCLKNNGTVMIYVSKNNILKKKYKRDFSKYINLCPELTDKRALHIISQLKAYIGSSNKSKISSMINEMKRGIVIHHGSMPLKARRLIEEFINGKYARICFSTSTLLQGVNMPVDIVWIDNFRFIGSDSSKELDIKNLIGRAGRTTSTEDKFDIGYIIVNKSNFKTFKKRVLKDVVISNQSLIDEHHEITNDQIEFADAISNGQFDDELKMPNVQIDRISKNKKLCSDVKEFLDLTFNPDTHLNVDALSDTEHYKRIKALFHAIYAAHLNRIVSDDKNVLTSNEQRILSTALRILFWKIQGRTFSEIVHRRYFYIVSGNAKNNIADKFVVPAQSIPMSENQNVHSLFKKGEEIDYDILVYDTYDYLDQVISYCVLNPVIASLRIYYKRTCDERALEFERYLRYCTNDDQEIMLLKYGFDFEDLNWVKKYVISVNAEELVFSDNLDGITEEQRSIIDKFLN